MPDINSVPFTTILTTYNIQTMKKPIYKIFPPVALMFLAAVTCVSGFIPFGHFVSSNGQAYDIHLNAQVAITSVCIAIVAIVLATFMYMKEQQPVADKLAATFKTLHRAAYRRTGREMRKKDKNPCKNA